MGISEKEINIAKFAFLLGFKLSKELKEFTPDKAWETTEQMIRDEYKKKYS